MNDRTYQMCGRFSMHTISLCISRFVCFEELYIQLDVQKKVLPFVLLVVFCNDIYPEAVPHYKI